MELYCGDHIVTALKAERAICPLSWNIHTRKKNLFNKKKNYLTEQIVAIKYVQTNVNIIRTKYFV